MEVEGNSVLKGSLNVEQSASFQSLSSQGNVSLHSTLDVLGDSVFSSSLTVNGETTLNSNLETFGTSSFNGNSIFSGLVNGVAKTSTGSPLRICSGITGISIISSLLIYS